MKTFTPLFLASTLVAALISAPAIAGDLDQVMKRLEALERENATLRSEMRQLKAGRTHVEPSAWRVKETPPSALAANTKAVAYKAPTAAPAPSFTWTGFYVGGHAGWGRETTTIHDPFSFCIAVCFSVPAFREVHPENAFGGLQLGWNYQVAHLVVGTEASFSWLGLRGNLTDSFTDSAAFSQQIVPGPGLVTQTVTASIDHTWFAKADWAGTATARMGIAWDRWLLYTKGGVAVVRNEYAATMKEFATNVSTPPFFPPFTFSSQRLLTGSDTRFGVAAGLGAEWAFWDNWSAMLDYTYMDFGEESVALSGISLQVLNGSGSPVEANSLVPIHQRLQILRFGINYRFAPTLLGSL